MIKKLLKESKDDGPGLEKKDGADEKCHYEDDFLPQLKKIFEDSVKQIDKSELVEVKTILKEELQSGQTDLKKSVDSIEEETKAIKKILEEKPEEKIQQGKPHTSQSPLLDLTKYPIKDLPQFDRRYDSSDIEFRWPSQD